MLHLTKLRSLVRTLGLRQLLLPLVDRMEQRQAAKIGSYTVTRGVGTSAVFEGPQGRVVLSGLTEAQLVQLALSPHERPTLTVVLSRLKPGTVAWDVGANVGFYSQLMSEVTGSAGQVIAVEPSGATFQELLANVASRSNVTPRCCALGNQEGTVQMATPDDYSSASRVLLEGDTPTEDLCSVVISKGDTLVSSGQVPQPAFIKVDVEGHELEVIRGLTSVLSSPDCKTVLVEVHFELLERAGHADAPREIQSILARCGLDQQTWIGRSHVLAERR